MKTIEKNSDPDPSRPLMIQRLRIGHENPAVEAPLSDFFANADYVEYRQLSSKWILRH